MVSMLNPIVVVILTQDQCEELILIPETRRDWDSNGCEPDALPLSSPPTPALSLHSHGNFLKTYFV